MCTFGRPVGCTAHANTKEAERCPFGRSKQIESMQTQKRLNAAPLADQNRQNPDKTDGQTCVGVVSEGENIRWYTQYIQTCYVTTRCISPNRSTNVLYTGRRMVREREGEPPRVPSNSKKLQQVHNRLSILHTLRFQVNNLFFRVQISSKKRCSNWCGNPASLSCLKR